LIAALGDAADPSPVSRRPRTRLAGRRRSGMDGGLSQRSARPSGQRWVETAKRFPANCAFTRMPNSPTPNPDRPAGARGHLRRHPAARRARPRRPTGPERPARHGARLSAVEQADAERARRNALAARKTAPDWTPSGAPRTLYGIWAPVPDWPSASWCATFPSASRSPINPAMWWPKAKRWNRRCWRCAPSARNWKLRTRQRLSAAEAAIFAAQRELLADPVLVRDALATSCRVTARPGPGSGRCGRESKSCSRSTIHCWRLARWICAMSASGFWPIAGHRAAANHADRTVDSGGGRPDPSDTLHLDTRHVVGWPPASAAPPRTPRFWPARWVCRPSWPPVPPCWPRPTAGSRSSTAARLPLSGRERGRSDAASPRSSPGKRPPARACARPVICRRPPPTATPWKSPPTSPIRNRQRRRWKPERKASA
jgi:hypothetical protein